VEHRTRISHLRRCLTGLWESEEGVAAAEYAIIAALVSLAILAPAATLGRTLAEVFLDLARGMQQRH
jgi:Flp pilus assembly pilin Flp